MEKLYATIETEWKKTEEEVKQLKAESKEHITEMAKMEKRVRTVDELEKENAELKKKIAELEVKVKLFFKTISFFLMKNVPLHSTIAEAQGCRAKEDALGNHRSRVSHFFSFLFVLSVGLDLC